MTPLVLGVAGGTGSGKTTVTLEIARRVGPERVAVINHDRYYHDLSQLPRDELHHHNFDHPEALETALMVEHLELLRAGQPAPLPVYDFSRHVRLPEVEVVEPRPVILVEGILVLAEPELRRLMDIRIFVDTDPDVRFIRRLVRDMRERGRTVEGVIEQYTSTVRPMHLEFVEPSKRWAHIIIPEGGFNAVALDLIVSRVLQELGDASTKAGGRS
ncbi:MAG TPA: uridine kinase [Acidobacteria bacterium]|nr:uridine kinase [Acidobacteriota bacterium]